MKLLTTGRFYKGTRTLIGHRLTPLGLVNCSYVVSPEDYYLVDATILSINGVSKRGIITTTKGHLSGERIRICFTCK